MRRGAKARSDRRVRAYLRLEGRLINRDLIAKPKTEAEAIEMQSLYMREEQAIRRAKAEAS